MAVYYRYRSGVDTFSVPVPAPSISVSELKRLILGTSRHGHGRTRGWGPREGIALSNAQTGEEYKDDGVLVPRNSTVVVRRVAGPPAEAIVASSPRRHKATQDGPLSGSAATSSASVEAEDDEAKAISAMIDAAELKWEEPRCYGRRGAVHDGRGPPAGYVCRRCRIPGLQQRQHCPTNGDPRFDFGRATTATPALAPAPVPVPGSPANAILAELHCKICKKVMADAVLTSKCCFRSFCDRCIRDHIVATSKCACGAQARADDLIPNPTLRTTITNMLATRTSSYASGGTEKPRSSVGSNAVAEPASESPAASQGSRRSHVSSEKPAASERSDGSGSTSTSAMAPAAHETRKVQGMTDTAEARASHADHYGYGVPFAPACYDPFFGGMPWAADPCMYYGGMPYDYGTGGYPMVPHHVDDMGNMPAVPPPRRDGGSYGHHGDRHGRKRTRVDCEEQSFKRRCGGSRSRLAV